MNYQETLNYLFTRLPMFQRVGAAAMKEDIGNIVELCNAIDNPEKKFKSIHLAGTNGKGSTAHICASILQEAGYKVGLYTSPHFRDFRERIKINGEYISESAVVNFVQKHQALISKIQPSFFEITVAMAFDYFAKEAVDIAVIETGLGGRLDSTNIVTPLVSTITNIGMDHEALLGNTLEKIAGEKAGIIKNKVPVVIGERHDQTSKVFEAKVKETTSSILFAQDIIDIELSDQTHQHNEYSVSSGHYPLLQIPNLKLDLTGSYQIHNLRTALCTIATLESQGLFKITTEHISNACPRVQPLSKLMGRWQVLSEKPLTICDGGHNADGLKYVTQGLEKLQKQLHIVLGTVNDKDLDKMLPLLPQKATYYFAKADIPRGLDANILQAKGEEQGLTGKAYTSVPLAYKAAQAAAQTDDCIFIGGSIFVVAEVV